jgi:hypothetical protein
MSRNHICRNSRKPLERAADTCAESLPSIGHDTGKQGILRSAQVMHEDRDLNVVVLAAPMRCIECGRRWEDGSERWRLKLLALEDPAETVPYCPECHVREFELD